jgi:hypothetical protein
MSVSRRTGIIVASLLLTMWACIVEKPVADDSIKQSRSVGLFALDCRAWLGAGLQVEAEASLIDLGEGESTLVYNWSFDGTEYPPQQERRPTGVGSPVKYTLKRRMAHVFEAPGLHEVAATVVNGDRVAGCRTTVLVAESKRESGS